jgi:sialic acid synthase SpsE
MIDDRSPNQNVTSLIEMALGASESEVHSIDVKNGPDNDCSLDPRDLLLAWTLRGPERLQSI